MPKSDKTEEVKDINSETNIETARNKNGNHNVRPMVVASILTAIAVVGSLFSFPVLGAKCAPIQHLVNIITAIILGPSWAFKAAFLASTIRNMLGLGTLFAFPGSIFGAILSGLLYQKTKNVVGAYVGEVFGTAIIGGLVAYPMATIMMNSFKGALLGFVPPFFISTAGGTILAVIIVTSLRKKRLAIENWIHHK